METQHAGSDAVDTDKRLRPGPPMSAHGAEQRVLIAVRQPAERDVIASRLLDAGLRVTTAATFGVVETLLQNRAAFDLMVIAQSSEETTLFGMPQLARSIDPELPILVLEFGTTNSPAVVDMVRGALMRWPMRARPMPVLH